MEPKYKITIDGEGTQDEISEMLKTMAMYIAVDGNLADGDDRQEFHMKDMDAELRLIKDNPNSKANNMNWDDDDDIPSKK